MKAIRKQLDIIDDIIINIEMAEKRKNYIVKYIDNEIMFGLFGEKKLKEKLSIKNKALSYWKRRLKREVNKLNEQL
ncbi:hypothetical protein CMI47_10945 [Candidatus Pacearchaeota archaeon]|jgi:hypothetical protein|nr:hypothetical protein [Candidatus Pacearchaeota archaeon]|tara:strand:- start:12442 stop:12669 length:228 start_codon:yes stop_codon:yes gene_type:complete